MFTTYDNIKELFRLRFHSYRTRGPLPLNLIDSRFKLTFEALSKNFSRHFDFFYLLFKEISDDISCEAADDSHEMSIL